MDDEVKSLLLEIGNQLREQNRMTEIATKEANSRLEQMRSRNLFDPEKMRAMTEERMAESKQLQAERGQAEAEYRQALIKEFQRLNANFEAFLERTSPL